MPMTFRDYSNPTPPFDQPISPTILPDNNHDNDDDHANDVVVLDDLVRTGEASRLRRRGAVRLDHTSVSSNSSARTRRRAGSAASVSFTGAVEPPVLYNYGWATAGASDPSGDDADGTWGWVSWRYPGAGTSVSAAPDASPSAGGVGQEEMIAAAEAAREGTVFRLYCGGVVDDLDEEEAEDDVHAWEPSPLPWAATASQPQPPRQKQTNGCGALIHVHAVPRWRCGAWTARCPGTDTVVPMPAEYFDSVEGAKFVRAACGCVREGIGCAACGNPLGTRYTPCQAAAGGLFTTAPCRARTPCYTVPSTPSSAAGPGPTTLSISTFAAIFVHSMPALVLPPAPMPPALPASISVASTATDGPLAFAPAAPASYAPFALLAGLAPPSALPLRAASPASTVLSSPGEVIALLGDDAAAAAGRGGDVVEFFDGDVLDADGVPIGPARWTAELPEGDKETAPPEWIAR